MPGRHKSSRALLLVFAIIAQLPAAEPAVDFDVKLEVVKQELNPGFCWFHPRIAAIPAAVTKDSDKNGVPRIVLTIQKHLVADDHYSGLYFMTSDDLGRSWSDLVLPRELDWQSADNRETIAVTESESWVTDSEFITGGKAHPLGANGSTFAARILWKPQ